MTPMSSLNTSLLHLFNTLEDADSGDENEHLIMEGMKFVSHTYPDTFFEFNPQLDAHRRACFQGLEMTPPLEVIP